MRNKIKFLGTVTGTILMILTVSCSKKTETVPVVVVTEEPVVQHDDLRDAVGQHDRKKIKSMADELALNADDLTPDQAVSVLMGFYDMHLQYSGEHKYRSDMETMRKFVDVYDIVNSNHGDKFKKALKATKNVYPDVDFVEVYKQFAEKLTQYDGSALSDQTVVAESKDTLKEEVQDELPPELRPAE